MKFNTYEPWLYMTTLEFFPRLMDQTAVTLGCLSACECREMYDLKQVPLSLTAAPEASSIVASKRSGCLPHEQRKPILLSNNSL